MRFDELNENNYLMFAIKNYENPQAVTQEDFYQDLKRFKYITRLFRHYKKTGELKYHLILNHFICLYNVFGEAATPLIFFKMDNEFWSLIKTFLFYLDRIPEYPRSILNEIPIDEICLNCLKKV
jgi:hypothetical protein